MDVDSIYVHDFTVYSSLYFYFISDLVKKKKKTWSRERTTEYNTPSLLEELSSYHPVTVSGWSRILRAYYQMQVTLKDPRVVVHYAL